MGTSWALLAALLAGQGVYLGSEWWLSLWSNATPQQQREAKWFWVYALLVALVMLLGVGRWALFFASTLRASTTLHNLMTRRVLHAPLAFFHQNPAGCARTCPPHA